MKKNVGFGVLALFALFMGIGVGGRILAQGSPESAQGTTAVLTTAFTYQGLLQDGGSPANGAYDLQFKLFDAASGGVQVGSTLTQNDVAVSNGLFTVQLDFGSVFDGNERYLETAVRPGSSTGSYTTLTPRQPLTAAPYAHYAAGAPWSGLSGVPAGFADGTDDGLTSVTWTDIQNRPAGLDDGDNDTTYSAGDGLALNGTQFNVATLPQAGNASHTLDSIGTTGQYPAIIIGLDGLPVISYYNATNGDLNVYHCNDMTCSSGTKTTLDSTGIVGEFSSITIGQEGFPLISYYDRTNGNLKLARCLSADCVSFSVATVDSTGDVGQWTSITTDKSGFAFISYYDVGGQNLKAVSCNNLGCTSPTIWTVDSTGDVGKYSSVVRNARSYVYISYYDATNGNLKVARCVSTSCSNPTINIVDGTDLIGGEEEDVGLWTSITVLMDDYPLIAYAKADQTFSTSQALVAHCTISSCSSATTNAIISMGSHSLQFQGFSVTVGPNGQGLATFAWNTASRVYMSLCQDLACTKTDLNDSVVINSAPRYTSLTIGADGLPIIVYYDGSSGDLVADHCSDLSCAPYLRRR